MADEMVAVLLPARTYSEFILRSGTHRDVGQWISDIVDDYLDRTRGDAGIWSEKHAEEVEAESPEHGDPSKGYQWLALFLPNGTKVRMTYKGQSYYGVVENERLSRDGKMLSPSEFASSVAGGTQRNAWRDLWFRFPGSSKWQLAQEVREGRR